MRVHMIPNEGSAEKVQDNAATKFDLECYNITTTLHKCHVMVKVFLFKSNKFLTHIRSGGNLAFGVF